MGDEDVNSLKESVYEEEDASEVSEEEDDGRNRRKVEDGGWGWVVVAASFVISMIADGISFSFGLIYVELLDYFGESKSKTSWVGSLFMAVPLLVGPLASALVDKYGCRSMTILGAGVSCLGFALSSLVDSIFALYLTFGLIAGLGLGLCYVTAVVSIAYWFDKRRSLATSLGACGTGIGTFVYAPLTQYLITEYGWRGTVLLLGGTLLNMSVCGALMREPDWTHPPPPPASSSSAASLAESFPGVDHIRRMLKEGTAPEYIMTATAVSRDDGLASPNFQSVVNLPTFVGQNEKVPLEVLEALGNNKRVFNVVLENYPSLLQCRSTSEEGGLGTEGSPAGRVPVRVRVKQSPKPRPPPPPPYRNTNYLKHIRIHRSSVMYRGAMLNIHKYRLRASSCPDIYRNSMTTIAKESEQSWRQELAELFKDMSDFSMFDELHFLLVSLATTIVFVWFIVPYFYLAEHMSRHGHTDQDASLVLSVIGITNTIGMVLFGWAADRPWLNVAKTYTVCLLGTGLFVVAMPLVSDNLGGLVMVGAGFGAFFASSYSFTPPLLVELVPLDRFTTAYGLSLLCQGIGNLLGPPLAGLMFDVTGSWDLSFYLAGIWIMLAGIFVALLPLTNNRNICGKGPVEKKIYGLP